MKKEFYIGQKLNGSYPPMCAIWCNMNNAYIEEVEKGVYEIKAIPKPTIEDKEKNVKSIRDRMINNISWRVDRAREQKELGLESVDDYQKLIEYKQYLRDYSESSETWYEENPKTFEEWVNG